MTAADLIDHDDPDARLLVLAAALALPDVTALLALADRFQELGDDQRELLARRTADALVRPVELVAGVGPITVADLLDHLDGPVVTLAAVLSILTTPAPSLRPLVRLSLLAALGVNRRAPVAALCEIDPLHNAARPGHHLEHGYDWLHRAAAALLARQPDTHPSESALAAAGHVVRAECRLLGRSTCDRDAKAARHRIGWCCSVASGIPLGPLVTAARRAAHERRRELWELTRLRNRAAAVAGASH